jgi:hypothetical protein
MPNPFPGMDPYLEGPLWTTVHSNLVEEIARQLAPKLRPRYLALTNRRVIVATPDALEFGPQQSRLPDVGVYKTAAPANENQTAVVTAPLVLDALLPETLEQSFVEIRDVAQRRLVTAIEVLSLTNKRGDGLDDYRSKRQEMLSGSCHFLEIDLLRVGNRFPVAGTLPSVPYFVFLSRADRRPRVEVWPIALHQPLPTVPVPLLPGDPDVAIDLQQAFQTIYELFAYDQAADHSGPPPIPLSPEQTQWEEQGKPLPGTSVTYIELAGGPTHFETYDPKN